VWLGVVSLCLVQFVDVLGVTVVVTALPVMLADLRALADAASLISTGYAMFLGGLLMFGARLGDRSATGASSCSAWRCSRPLSWGRRPCQRCC
jgi:MFS family permease